MLEAGKVSSALAPRFGGRKVVYSLSRFSRAGRSFRRSVAFQTPILCRF
jgi:hypothetical protein